MAKSSAAVSSYGANWHGAYRPHARASKHFHSPSRTRDEFREECDINTIMRRYEKTGVISHAAKRAPRYMDCTGVPDLRQALDVLNGAEAAFSSLPARVRKEFDNDPVKFVEFAMEKENLPQLREWGLAEPEKAPEAPMKVEVVNKDPGPSEKP